MTDRAVNPEQTVVDRETSVSIEGNFTTPETLAAVSANWTVGGQPASAATCGDVASIEFSFTNGTDTVTFEAPCASGSVTSDPALGEGTWTGTVTLLDAAGNAIGETTTVEAFTVAAGNTSVTLGAIAFPAQTNPIIHVTFRYETGVDTDTYGTCASEQVTQNYMFYLLDADENEPSFFTPPTACVDSLDIEVPDALAQYSIEISGRSADGTVKWGGEPCSGLQGDESVTFECDIEAVP